MRRRADGDMALTLGGNLPKNRSGRRKPGSGLGSPGAGCPLGAGQWDQGSEAGSGIKEATGDIQAGRARRRRPGRIPTPW